MITALSTLAHAAHPAKVACIGSRQLAEGMTEYLERIGQLLAEKGYFVASGGAQGADQAFMRGCAAHRPRMGIVYLPWLSYESDERPKGVRIRQRYTEEHHVLAARHHPYWDNLRPGAKCLLLRNAALVDQATIVVACPRMNQDLKPTGGTAHGLRIAMDLGIPIVQVTTPHLAEQFLAGLERV